MKIPDTSATRWLAAYHLTGCVGKCEASYIFLWRIMQKPRMGKRVVLSRGIHPPSFDKVHLSPALFYSIIYLLIAYLVLAERLSLFPMPMGLSGASLFSQGQKEPN
jgi:hypothetical protein